jgi:Uma2 family endonuclease
MDRVPGALTVDDYLSLPADAPRCELVEGVLHVTPAPNIPHQLVVSELLFRLISHCRRRRLGEVIVAPFDVVLGPRTVVQPDVLFVSAARFEEVLGGMKRGYGGPDLVVEVLSKSTRRFDRDAKRRAYSRAGVRELWLVDPERRTIELWRRGPRALVRRALLGVDEHLVSEAVPGFRVRVGLLFASLER